MTTTPRETAFDRFNKRSVDPTQGTAGSSNQNSPPANGGGENLPPLPPPTIPRATQEAHVPAPSQISQTVARFLTDCDDRYDPDHVLVGREEDVDQLSVLLTLDEAKNVLLSGEPGIGKSALVQHILNCSATGKSISLDLYKRTFYRLDIEALLASDDVTQINDHIKEIVTFLERRALGVLVIDNAWNFIKGLNDKGALGALNTLMAAIGRGKFQSFMIVSEEHREQLIQTHPAFNEIFTQHKLSPQKPDQVLKTLRGKRAYYQDYYGIVINDDGLRAVADLSEKYPSAFAGNLQQPGRAIRLLEFICAAHRNAFMSKPADLRALEAEVRNLQLEKTAINGSNPTRTAEILARLTETAPQLESLQQDWAEKTKGVLALTTQKKDMALKLERTQEARGKAESCGANQELVGCEKLIETYRTQLDDLNQKLTTLNIGQPADHPLTREKILNLFAHFTGIDAAAAGQDELERIVAVEDTLKKNVMGQDHAVHVVATALRNKAAGFCDDNRPLGAFFFLGPTGVGKTELARTLNESVSGIPGSEPVRFDMSEYQEAHAVATLLGAPPGYQGAKEGGILVNRIRANPKCVALFDEIEKADAKIFDVLLPILDNGTIQDRRGIEAKFNGVIVIVTSNIGAEYFLDPSLSFEEAQQQATELLYKKIRPEILGRFNNIVFFKGLSNDAQFSIANKFLCARNKLLAPGGFQLAMGNAEIEKIRARYYSPAKGGRSLRNVFEGPISDAASDIIIAENLKAIRGAYGPDVKTPPGGVIDICARDDGTFAASFRPKDQPAAGPSLAATGPH